MAVHLHDVGTVFELTVVDQDGDIVDLSNATTRQIIFRKPNGTTLTKTATVVTDGQDGRMQCISAEGDIDKLGLWRWRGYVVTTSGKWHSDQPSFEVQA